MENMMLTDTLRVENCSSHCTTPAERIDQPVTVKVGCLHINPATRRGRRMFLVQMLVLCFVPHAALIIQNCAIITQLSSTLDSSLYLHSEVTMTLLAGSTAEALQNERYQILNYSLLPHDLNRFNLERVFAATDENFMALAILVDNQHIINLYHLREDILNNGDLKKLNFFKRLSVYEEINSALLLYIMKNIKYSTSTLWRQLSASYELLRAMEEISLAYACVIRLGTEVPELETVAKLENHQLAIVEHLQLSLQFVEVEKLVKNARVIKDVMKFYKQNRIWIHLDNVNGIQPLKPNEMELYVAQLKHGEGQLKEVQDEMWNIVRETATIEIWLARRTLGIGVAILCIVLSACPVLILLLRHTVQTIQSFTHSIEQSTLKLIAEKQKSDLLLSRMLPIQVLRRLRSQKTVPAEAFDAVTIFFSDIVGFTNISASSTPMEVINMLNMLYRLFDEKIMQYDVYKVETIGDAYMVVSGLPQRNGNRHVSEIADMSLSLMRSLDGAKVPHRSEVPLRIRAGVNTGPCVAGVVGSTMPRYCLFGDTINTASRMESTGEAMKIHISYTTKQALDEFGVYQIEPRGELDVAGKGSMQTFWLLGKVGGDHSESPRGLRLQDYDHNLLELIIRS